MTADSKIAIQTIWQQTYDLLRGPARPRALESYKSLPPKFDEGLLNDIVALQNAAGSDLQTKVGDVRSKLNICASVGLFAEADVEKLQAALDMLI